MKPKQKSDPYPYLYALIAILFAAYAASFTLSAHYTVTHRPADLSPFQTAISASPDPVTNRRVRVTAYSQKDSCHYPDGKGGCLTASGSVATAHRTVACPRDMKLGTRIVLGDKEYICEDRYAKWVQAKHGDTVDVFVGYGADAYRMAIALGERQEIITLK